MRLKRKADRLLQELVRSLYQYCEVCGKEMNCGHHYFPKSMADILRYDLENIIPLCNGCHVQHHAGNPDIHSKVLELRGKEWEDNLRIKKERAKKEGFKANISWIQDKINNLETVDN